MYLVFYANCLSYKAGVEKGDKIISVDGMVLDENNTFDKIIKTRKPKDTIEIVFERFGERKTTKATLGHKRNYTTKILENSNEKTIKKRKEWLHQ